ncbi:MAG TPA: SDR family oxidoreductase [Bryobacteraceae bacterium]|nr:SDR family oxidoreductase [Bryobacteraceae bacterium]
MSNLFITGSTGIAAATARLWGGRVFVFGEDEASCRELSPEYAVGDVRDEAAVSAAIARCGQIDAVFNVAGISARKFGDGPLHECTAEGWDAAMDVNAKGTFLVCREVVKVWMAEGRRGSILNTSSVLARRPEAGAFGTIGYAASKGAVEAMSLAAAAQYAAAGIRINVLAPGLVKTPMSARAQSDEQIQKYIAGKQPLSGGMLSAEEVARVAVFLLGEGSGPITGQVITVDGGWSVA